MFRSIFFLALAGIPITILAAGEIEEVVVTAGFRDAALMKSAGSISVIDDTVIHARAARHFDQTINTLPNVSFSAGGARARFVQVRGVGDLEQFVDPKHFPSVGVSIDGIPVGTTTTGAVLMDVEQIEILRGPQGTQFGANALAGMVNIQTRDPGERFEGRVHAGYGNYDSWRAGASLSGPLSESMGARIAIQQQKSDGYYDNAFLDRDDTNRRDELSLRGKLQWRGANDSSMDLIASYSDIDSGYDAFSLDNTRTTLSDNPGRDAQESIALAVKAGWHLSRHIILESVLTWQLQDEEYAFDEDWVFAGFCDGVRCDPRLEFSSTDRMLRDRDNWSVDLRLKSDPGRISWVAGLFARQRDEALERQHFVAFNSDYETGRYAVYGELQWDLSQDWLLTGGLRYEHFEDDYADSNGLITDSSDNYWSGRLNLEYGWTEDVLLYASLARAVKPGGVNTETSSSFPLIDASFQPFLAPRRRFGAETLFNREVGIKGYFLDQRLSLRAALFHMKRDNAQLESFVWDASTFIFTGFLDSSSDAENYGMELELEYALADTMELFANLGYLETSVDELTVFDLDTSRFVRRKDRDQAKAPRWQYNFGLSFSMNEKLGGRIEVEGRDDSFFGYYHNGKLDAYTLVHASLSYRLGDVRLQGWVRNLLDEDYHIHGLYFANDPRDAFNVNRSYYQFGEPRVYGLNLEYSF